MISFGTEYKLELSCLRQNEIARAVFLQIVELEWAIVVTALQEDLLWRLPAICRSADEEPKHGPMIGIAKIQCLVSSEFLREVSVIKLYMGYKARFTDVSNICPINLGRLGDYKSQYCTDPCLAKRISAQMQSRKLRMTPQ